MKLREEIRSIDFLRAKWINLSDNIPDSLRTNTLALVWEEYRPGYFENNGEKKYNLEKCEMHVEPFLNIHWRHGVI